MFPRRYFAGRYFPPRYFPQSAGAAPPIVDVHMICGSVTITARIGGTVALEALIGGTVETVEC